MPTCKTPVTGVGLHYDADGSEPFTQIASIKSLSGPSIEVDIEEETALDTTWKEFCASYSDAGEISGDSYFTKANYALFLSTLRATVYYYKIDFPLLSGESTKSKLVAQGILRQIGLEVPETGRVMVPFAIKLTGALTFTAGS